LPINLKKLVLKGTIQQAIDDSKIPFGCEVIIKSIYNDDIDDDDDEFF
jgi:hypothetical protein